MVVISEIVALVAVIATKIVASAPLQDTFDRIVHDGYPAESHTVTTSDNYILKLHRIPPKTPNSLPVFMMHGLLSSSSDFIILGPKRALAYKLWEAGFDVWMGNARGNTYSRKHKFLSSHTSAFWRFSWHEIGTHDLPAMIDYALEKSGRDRLQYIGHSQGTTTLLVLLSEKPDYNDKINSAHFMAPVAYVSHMKSPTVRLACPTLSLPNPPAAFGSIPIFTTGIHKDFTFLSCDLIPGLEEFCKLSIFEISGFNFNNLDDNLLADIYATSPAGSSASQTIHYCQEYVSKYFRRFDYGPYYNVLYYGTTLPPKYDLHKNMIPMFLYYGENDVISDPEDVQRLKMELSNVSLIYKVKDPNWTHLDFIWGRNADTMVYDVILIELKKRK